MPGGRPSNRYRCTKLERSLISSLARVWQAPGSSGRLSEGYLFRLPGTIKPPEKRAHLAVATSDQAQAEPSREPIGETVTLTGFRVRRIEKGGLVENSAVQSSHVETSAISN